MKINSRFPFSTSVLSQIVSLLFREKNYPAVIEMCFYSHSLRNSCSKIPIEQAGSSTSLFVHHGIAYASFYLVCFLSVIEFRNGTTTPLPISRKWFLSALHSCRDLAKRRSKRSMAQHSLRCAAGRRFASIIKRRESAISMRAGRLLCCVEMFRLGSAARVLDLLLDTLREKLGIREDDPVDVENPMSCMYFDALLLKSEVLLCDGLTLPGVLPLSSV